jgi:phage-related minor tail protein
MILRRCLAILSFVALLSAVSAQTAGTISGTITDFNGFAIPGTGSFGTITSTRPGIDMRELQFSLKLYF